MLRHLIIVWLCQSAMAENGSGSALNLSIKNDHSFNSKIIWNSEEMIIIKRTCKDNLENASVSSRGQLHDDSASQPCENLNVFQCLNRECKWLRGKCGALGNVNGTAPFPRPLPETFSELIELIEVMWNNPPPIGSPVIWLTFLGSTLAIAVVLVLGVFYSICKLCYKLIKKESVKGKVKRFPGNKLVLVLPGGRKIPIGEYVIDYTGDHPKTILIPKSMDAEGGDNVSETLNCLNLTFRNNFSNQESNEDNQAAETSDSAEIASTSAYCNPAFRYSNESVENEATEGLPNNGEAPAVSQSCPAINGSNFEEIKESAM